jgi:putative hydrolase of the HAD superfamily
MTRAVLLDAMGTLVGFGAPAPRLVEELAARGVAITGEEAARAMRAEIAYYRAHHDEAADRAALAALRDRCATVVREAIGAPVARLPQAELVAALLAAIEFSPYPEVPDVLRELRARGMALVVCSNWDISLHDVLDATGLSALLSGTVTSAEHGAAKPDPSIFAAALALAGADPGEAIHVGDDVGADVEGARAAGIRPVLLARDSKSADVPAGVPVLRTLAGLPALAA